MTCWSIRGRPGGTLPAARRLGRMLADGPVSTGSMTCRPRARSSRYFQLFPAKQRPGVVGHRVRLLAARPRSAAQPVARHGPPAGPACARPGLPSSRPPTCPGAAATSPAFICPRILRCWCPAAPPTGWPSAGRRSGIRHWRNVLAERGIASVIIGAGAEQGLAAEIPAGDRPDRPDQFRRSGRSGPSGAFRRGQ